MPKPTKEAVQGAVAFSRRSALWAIGCGWASRSLAIPVDAQEGTRTALVLGNASYPGMKLVNATNDARLVATTLKNLGFRVRLLADTSFDDLLTAVKAWLAESDRSRVRMLYFAGHGAQYRGQNFLLPIDARLRSEDDLPGASLNVQDLTDRLSRFETGVNLVVLDACRSNPGTANPGSMRSRGSFGVQPSATGLTATLAPRGTLIAYSTAPGAVAADNPQVGHSIYTLHFVRHLSTPGLPIEAVFKRTRAAVVAASGGTQVPWESSSLVNDFCLAPHPTGACGSTSETIFVEPKATGP